MAGPRTEQNGKIVKQDGGAPRVELRDLLTRMAPEIRKALPKHVSPDRMTRIALTALSSTPKLAQCTPQSFLGAVVQASQLGLEVNTPLGHAYLIPYEDRRNRVVTCQLVLGYQGMLELTRRSGMVTAIYAFAVRAGDAFAWELGLDPKLTHVPSEHANREEQPLTHVYAVAKLKAGEPIFTVLSKSEVEKYRARSRASESGPWQTDYEAMALKTAIRRLFRWLPKSAEMARAEAVDEALELGRSQLSASDPDVIDALQKHGIEAADLPVPADDYDPQTGEVHPSQSQPEPGAGDAP